MPSHDPHAGSPERRGDDVDALVEIAGLVADAARHQTLAAFRHPLVVRDKADDGSGEADPADRPTARGHRFDPVTAADRGAEAAMREVLASRRPDDGIRGEELRDVAGTSGLTWVLDPIDGTRAFVSGMPTWGTLVAVADERGPFVGVIDQPWVDERFVGISRGARREAWLDRGGRRTTLRARADRDLGEAVLFTTFPEVGTRAEREAFERVRDRVRMTRYGADCYAYALLAAGHVDLVIEAGLESHDVHALVPVVEGAGGITSAWDGTAGHEGGRFLAAATPDLQRAAMALLADERPPGDDEADERPPGDDGADERPPGDDEAGT